MRSSFLRAGSAAIVSLVLAGCPARSSSPTEPARPATPAAPVSTGTVPHAASITLPSPSTTASPRSDETGPQGTIACGAAVCRVGAEKCCPLDGGFCAPVSPAQGSYCTKGDQTRGALFCDDSSDCPAGQSCCWDAADSENLYTHCAVGPCALGQACHVGGPCPSGFECSTPDKPNPGTCEWKSPQAPCGARTCTGATPACCWNGRTKTARCVADKPGACTGDEGPTTIIRCMAPSDCGGSTCCAGPSRDTYCQGECINAGVVCRTKADCPPTLEGASLVDCVAASPPEPGELPKVPPWYKECSYASK